MLLSFSTSHSKIKSESHFSANGLSLFFIDSLTYEKASFAPHSLSFSAIPQAIDFSLAIPRTIPFCPLNL